MNEYFYIFVQSSLLRSLMICYKTCLFFFSIERISFWRKHIKNKNHCVFADIHTECCSMSTPVHFPNLYQDNSGLMWLSYFSKDTFMDHTLLSLLRVLDVPSLEHLQPRACPRLALLISIMLSCIKA